MRIALVAEYPAAPDRALGGVQTVVARLGRALARRPDLEVHAVSFELDREEPGVDRDEGVTVHRFPRARRFGNVTFGLFERRGTAQALRRIRPDVVHAHLLGAAALGAVESGFPCVATVHGIVRDEARLESGGAGRIRAWARVEAEEQSLRSLRHVVLSSPYVRECLGERLDHLSTHSIENPVDEAFFRVGPPSSPRVVLVPSRLIPRKDPAMLLEAAALLARRGESFAMRFTGAADDPGFLEGLRRRAGELGVADRVTFLGSLPVADLLREFEGAGVVALGSLAETSPLAVMEAMAAGRPVVAADVGGVRHLVEAERSGWIVPPRDAEAAAQALGAAFADPARARELGERGREIALGRFHVDAIVEQTLAVYAGVIAGAHAGATS